MLDAAAELGECPVWSAKDNALYWVDIKRPSLNRFDPSARTNHVMPMPTEIGSFTLRKKAGFVLALKDGIWLANAAGELQEKVADAPFTGEAHRFNDGKCDRQGRFLVGSMNERRDASDGGLWRLDHDLRLTQLFGDLMVSNALAWSPDGRTMYHADTATLTVSTYSYETSTGTPVDRKRFASWDAEDDRPDGATVDQQGNYWLALYRGGRIVTLSAQGQLLAEYPLPARCPTMCAFGGPDLRTLYVTTSRHGRSTSELRELPQSGGLFAMRTSVPGIPEPRFGI
ncbi:SMP-30/gluconolactonase/LRE family protein [Paraburkholderia agricolaris]|uniref:SMP-30/gluconolactonase/LRE family protein n=1 Tax=Paraburkholderia agricolaris TaxID=2152888 RepID=A0ABW8ZW97_9BURK|nr:SMP-30/gluconolactonase/LRE family protein [Paraburkholderia agricolaris]